MESNLLKEDKLALVKVSCSCRTMQNPTKWDDAGPWYISPPGYRENALFHCTKCGKEMHVQSLRPARKRV